MYDCQTDLSVNRVKVLKSVAFGALQVILIAPGVENRTQLIISALEVAKEVAVPFVIVFSVPTVQTPYGESQTSGNNFKRIVVFRVRRCLLCTPSDTNAYEVMHFLGEVKGEVGFWLKAKPRSAKGLTKHL
jgi:hypothetical protein